MAHAAGRRSTRAIEMSSAPIIARQAAAACGALYPIFTYLGYYTLGNAGNQPARDAPAEEYARYFEANTNAWSLSGLYVELLGLVCLLVFTAALWSELSRQRPARDWLAAALFGGGVMMASMKMASAAPYIVAMQRADDGLDPHVARALLDFNNAGFVLTWFPLAVLIGTAAALVLRTRALPVWLGWSGAALAAALFIGAPLMWSTERAMVVFILALTWIGVASLLLIRRVGQEQRRAE